MGRERYIPLTDAELRRMEEEVLAKKKLVEIRQALIAKTLQSQRKESLLRILKKLCGENIHARWMVEAEMGMMKPVELVLHDLREAIQLATYVDEKQMNSNFSVDWDAYSEVKRLMEMLVSLDAMGEAMEIAIHFVRQASRQLEYCDEGMMLEEIEKCLQPVFEALENHEEAQRSAWASSMQAADLVGFICHAKLQEWAHPQIPK